MTCASLTIESEPSAPAVALAEQVAAANQAAQPSVALKILRRRELPKSSLVWRPCVGIGDRPQRTRSRSRKTTYSQSEPWCASHSRGLKLKPSRQFDRKTVMADAQCQRDSPHWPIKRIEGDDGQLSGGRGGLAVVGAAVVRLGQPRLGPVSHSFISGSL